MTRSAEDTITLLTEIAALEPAARLGRLLRERDPCAALLAMSDEAERLVVSDLSLALSTAHAVRALADEQGEPAAKTRARRALAHALAYSNRYPEALDMLGEARGIATGADMQLEVAKIDLFTLHALARLGRFDEALKAGSRAHGAFLAKGEPGLAARAEINLGAVCRMRDDPAAAIEHFDRARPVVIAEPAILAQLDSNRAEALLDLNRFADAEAAFESALRAFEAMGAARAASIVIGNLADLMSRQGRLDQAVAYFERARERLGDQAPGDQARLQAEHAQAVAAIGLHDEAAELYEGAIATLDSTGLAVEAARARAGLGQALVALERPDEAEEQLGSAVAAFEALGHGTGVARAAVIRAGLVAARGDGPGAESLLRQALQTLAARPADAAIARLLFSQVALQSGDVVRAEADAEAAVEAALSLDLAPLLADSLTVRSRVRRAQSRATEATADLRRALGHVERVRGTLHAHRFRAAFLGGRTDVYEDCFSDALDRADEAGLREAFGTAELAKSRTLLDLLNGGLGLGGALSTAHPEHALVEQLGMERAALNALYCRLDDPLKPGPGAARGALGARLREAELTISGIESRLAATNRFAAVFGERAQADDILSSVGDSAAFIEFFEERRAYTALVLAGGRIRAFRGLITVADARELAERIHFQVGRALGRGLPVGLLGRRLLDDVRRELQRLDHLLVAPIRDAIGNVERLWVAPHGVLHAVPLHAGWSGAGYCVERFGVAYVPSASVFKRLRAVRPQPTDIPDRALLIGMPRPDLPAIGSEVEHIRAVRPDADALVGAAATRAAFVAHANRAGLVHVASHARFDPRAPMLSGFELADGWFTVRDAYGLKLPASTVVLTGCETGRAAVRAGDEIVGLAHAFLAGGARSLVVSQWPAHDQTTAELIGRTYGMWYSERQEAVAVGAALRAAQLEVMREHPHPAVWAPFLTIGDA